MSFAGSPLRRVSVLLPVAIALLSAGAIYPDLVRLVFTSNGFLPHGVCYAWQPGLVWLHVVSDALIGIAYFSIPIALLVFVRRRKDLPFHWIFLLFGLFIISCGATHVLSVWTLWTPQYWLDGAVKAITAMASVPTAIATVALIPKALALPSTTDLREANEQLRRENEERTRAEAALREAQATLEERVAQRTRELTEANVALATANGELRKLAQELRRANAIANVFVDQTPIGLALLDRDLRYVRVNAALARINGLAPEDHLGKTIAETLPYLPPGAAALQRRVMETGVSVIAREVSGRTSSSEEERHWNVSYYPVIADTETIGLGVLCEETTEKKRLEAERVALLESEKEARASAEAASTAKDQFLAAVSHELRNPLQSILGWVQALELGAIHSPRAPDIVRRITASAKLQARLIDDLLDASRIVTGKLVIDRRPLSLRELTRQASDEVRPRAASAGIELIVRLADDPVMLEGDGDRLRQVVGNLLTNALKFTPAGGRIAITLLETPEAVALEVSDTGRGIAPDFLPLVFEPFRQERKAPGERGLGLGLSIVREIVQLHGGSVSVASAGLGRGATFTVRLPKPAVVWSTESMDGLQTTTELRGVRIVLVDDEDDPREAISALLERCGAQVVAAAGVDEAIRRIHLDPPQLIISDIAMPERDGFSLLRALRSDARTNALPVIALSAFAGGQAESTSLTAGFDRHLAKPVDAQLLVQTLVDVLKGRPTDDS